MGAVYLAEDAARQRQVALKVLPKQQAKDGDILVTKDGVAKILDLGLVKHIDDVTVSFKTATGMAMGTPHYLSPA